MERPRFSDHLEAIKFICKDFWSELFKKQIDNLKANHRVANAMSIDPVPVIVTDSSQDASPLGTTENKAERGCICTFPVGL
ncbi:hypothetical protein MKW94_001012 [Papaver nudicaule]|uniref:Uncharacterized protein n=1 Tax=Papaver nudicaule TaxID=74823 RepID=A0AA41VF87_PAPNU|nr:hypothetical protein [Papaver nudicaule]